MIQAQGRITRVTVKERKEKKDVKSIIKLQIEILGSFARMW